MAAKLVIYEVGAGDGQSYTANMFPTLADNDITLFYQEPREGSEVPVMKIHKFGEQANYTSKRRSSTILETAVDLSADHMGEIINTYGRYQVWNVIAENDIGIAVRALIAEIKRIVTDDQADFSGLDEINTVFTTGGTYSGVEVNADGDLTTLGQLTYTPPVPPPPADIWDSTTEAHILSLIDSVVPAVKYEGFNPAIIRSFFLEKFPDNEVATRNLILGFIAYSHIGNNILKLQVRRVNLDISKKLMQAVETLGIKKNDRTRNGLTLPRIAIAFMPEYLIYRKFLGGELQSQTESSIDVSYKDICFYGCPAIRSMAGYEQFHLEFSSYIYKKGEEVDVKDEAFLKVYKRWNKVSNQGYNTDRAIHPKMAVSISSSGLSKKQAYENIRGSIISYRS